MYVIYSPETSWLFTTPYSGPFVTAVGATNGTSQERAAYFSGGGFSNYFPQPPYQSRAVESYLGKLGDKYAGLFKWVSSTERSIAPC